MKRVDASQGDLVAISVRVPREVADRLKAIAGAEYRPVAAEVRRLIEERVANAEPDAPVDSPRRAA